LAIDVVPRKENDALNFTWKPKQPVQEELEDVFSKIKDKAFIVGKSDGKESKQQAVEVSLPVETIKVESGKEDSLHKMNKEDSKIMEEKPKQEPENLQIKNLTRLP
jgi:hypothetical protein